MPTPHNKQELRERVIKEFAEFLMQLDLMKIKNRDELIGDFWLKKFTAHEETLLSFIEKEIPKRIAGESKFVCMLGEASEEIKDAFKSGYKFAENLYKQRFNKDFDKLRSLLATLREKMR